jgi:hypothetical protein
MILQGRINSSQEIPNNNTLHVLHKVILIDTCFLFSGRSVVHLGGLWLSATTIALHTVGSYVQIGPSQFVYHQRTALRSGLIQDGALPVHLQRCELFFTTFVQVVTCFSIRIWSQRNISNSQFIL